MRGYSIDSFSDYSPLAVSRTPAKSSVTFYNRQDEELFRDLFGAEPDSEAREAGAFDGVAGVPHKKSKPKPSSKGIQWATGATLVKPFGQELPRPQPPTSARHNQPAVSNPPPQSAAPSLSVAAPRLDVTELLTARPESNDEARDEATGLARVPECDDEEDTEVDESRPEIDHRGNSVRRRQVPQKKPVRQSHAAVKQEPLQFLEKLDLKTLMAQPRPDVMNFYPSTVATAVAPVQSQDPRLEEDVDSSHRLVEAGRKLPSARKDMHEVSSRLAHMELTYGTTAVEPRKARKETLTRLSNPISGHSSTLLALPPELRKKRDNALSPSAPRGSVKKPLTSRLLDGSNVYEAAAVASRSSLPKSTLTKKLVRGGTPTARSRSTNQEDDASDRLFKRPSQTMKKPSVEERKTALKKRLAERKPSLPQPDMKMPSVPTGSTFLTQHEESEGKLAESTRRGAGRTLRPTASSKPSRQPQPPERRPIGGRHQAADSTTTTKRSVPASRPAPRLRAQPSKAKDTGDSSSRRRGRRTVETPATPTPSRSKRSVPASDTSGTAASSLLLAGSTGPKTPIRSAQTRTRPTTLPVIRRLAPAASSTPSPLPKPPKSARQ